MTEQLDLLEPLEGDWADESETVDLVLSGPETKSGKKRWRWEIVAWKYEDGWRYNTSFYGPTFGHCGGIGPDIYPSQAECIVAAAKDMLEWLKRAGDGSELAKRSMRNMKKLIKGYSKGGAK